jgi:hypothetical protein
MFTIPFLAFYVGTIVFQDKQHPDNWAGGCANVATNIIIGYYCSSAFMEEEDEEPRYDDQDGRKRPERLKIKRIRTSERIL